MMMLNAHIVGVEAPLSVSLPFGNTHDLQITFEQVKVGHASPVLSYFGSTGHKVAFSYTDV